MQSASPSGSLMINMTEVYTPTEQDLSNEFISASNTLVEEALDCLKQNEYDLAGASLHMDAAWYCKLYNDPDTVFFQAFLRAWQNGAFDEALEDYCDISEYIRVCALNHVAADEALVADDFQERAATDMPGLDMESLYDLTE